MAKTELKTIPVNKILANFTQPRERFDKEKIKELAESILSNDLINPITIKEYKGGRYMIVSGERRWQAHKVAGLKNIQAFVKEYKDKIQEMVESLVENWQREDLTSVERENCVYNLWKTGKFKSKRELAKRLGASESIVGHLISAKEDRKRLVVGTTVSTYDFDATIGLKDKDRKEVLKKVEKGKLESGKVRDYARTIKKAPEEIKESLLSDEITTKQAEDISKIHSPKAREQALKQVKQYRHIADITPKLMEKSKPESSEALKRRFMTSNRIIFENLNEAKVSLIKANKNMLKANSMLDQLILKSFEYGLSKKDLNVTIQQMKSITDKITEFNIGVDKFDELKEVFVERVEDKLNEER